MPVSTLNSRLGDCYTKLVQRCRSHARRCAMPTPVRAHHALRVRHIRFYLATSFTAASTRCGAVRPYVSISASGVPDSAKRLPRLT